MFVNQFIMFSFPASVITIGYVWHTLSDEALSIFALNLTTVAHTQEFNLRCNCFSLKFNIWPSSTCEFHTEYWIFSSLSSCYIFEAGPQKCRQQSNLLLIFILYSKSRVLLSKSLTPQSTDVLILACSTTFATCESQVRLHGRVIPRCLCWPTLLNTT